MDIDLLTFFERGFYMDTDTFTQPRRICDRTGAHLSKRSRETG